MQIQNNQLEFYGAAFIGPSGVGKTTLCQAMGQLLDQFNRKFIRINLDPAAINQKQNFQIDIANLIQLDEIMEQLQLGPNASLIYAMDFLDKNISWLEDQIIQYKDHYLLFDLPGQIELYLQNDSIKNIFSKFSNIHNEKLTIQVTIVELFDVVNIYKSNEFLSQCLMNLVSQINLELPYISVLSKIDILKELGVPPFSLEFYFEAKDLKDLFEKNKNQEKLKFEEKYSSFSSELAELIDTFEKVSFIPLSVEHKELMVRLLLLIDQSNGFYYLETQVVICFKIFFFKDPKYQQIQQTMILDEPVSTELIMMLESELFPEEF